MRTIDPEQNWFFQQGKQDGLEGQLRIPPDEARSLLQRSDYYAGYAVGREERAARKESEVEDAFSDAYWRRLEDSPEEATDVEREVDAEYDPETDSIGSWREAIAELKRTHNPNEDSR